MIYLKPKRLFVVVDIYRLKVTISKNTPFLVNFDLILWVFFYSSYKSFGQAEQLRSN